MGTASTYQNEQEMNIRVGILTAPKIESEPADGGFLLRNVRIGIGFHWDRQETQQFTGELQILSNKDGTQTAVNELDIEDYLCSVISSEMSSNSPEELLKAHAVISRSWAIRAIEANRQSLKDIRSVAFETGGHIGFDVCADDHCQRYEGTGRMNSKAVSAVKATKGEVLTYGDEICDTRFHKCCGGRTEVFSTCWEDKDVPYLQSVECPWCDTDNKDILTSVLNDYDQETRDFHDWQVSYTAAELGDIIRDKTGIDLGEITALVPLLRGQSGRIYRLRIEGTKGSTEIGKELKIRRALSPTCLYSSWFDVERTANGFTLRGKGWGHGVGLCQIGAAVMAANGADYKQILQYYYPGTLIRQIH